MENEISVLWFRVLNIFCLIADYSMQEGFYLNVNKIFMTFLHSSDGKYDMFCLFSFPVYFYFTVIFRWMLQFAYSLYQCKIKRFPDNHCVVILVINDILCSEATHVTVFFPWIIIMSSYLSAWNFLETLDSPTDIYTFVLSDVASVSTKIPNMKCEIFNPWNCRYYNITHMK